MRGVIHQHDDHLTLAPSMLAALQMALGIFGSIFTLIGVGALVYWAQGGDPVRAFGAVVIGNMQGAFITLLFSLGPIIQVFVTHYRIDRDGVVVSSQLLQKSEQRVGWEKITALQQKRGILGTLFGFSDLVVVAYGERGTKLHLRGIRDIDTLRKLLGDEMQKAVSVPAILQSD